MEHDHITEKVIGCFYDVYNCLGNGFLELVYQNAMEIALSDSQIVFMKEAALNASFRGRLVGEFRTDFLVENLIIVEIKAVSQLLPSHSAQVLNYLRASQLSVGFLLNFGNKAEIKRIVF
jgi:GxxExxY protein